MNAKRPENMPEITWQTDNLSLEACAYLLRTEVDDLREVVSRPNFALHADARAAGWWDANERELHAMWRSLARLAREVKKEQA
jgi:hypothetical protein